MLLRRRIAVLVENDFAADGASACGRTIVGVGMIDLHFRAVVQTIAIGVREQRVGAIERQLFEVEQAVAVAVSMDRRTDSIKAMRLIARNLQSDHPVRRRWQIRYGLPRHKIYRALKIGKHLRRRRNMQKVTVRYRGK